MRGEAAAAPQSSPEVIGATCLSRPGNAGCVWAQKGRLWDASQLKLAGGRVQEGKPGSRVVWHCGGAQAAGGAVFLLGLLGNCMLVGGCSVPAPLALLSSVCYCTSSSARLPHLGHRKKHWKTLADCQHIRTFPSCVTLLMIPLRWFCFERRARW